MRSKFVAAVILTAVVVMALVATSFSARPLATGADASLGAGDAQAAVVSGKQILQFLRRLYLQQLGAEPSCQTNSSNGGCPPPSSG